MKKILVMLILSVAFLSVNAQNTQIQTDTVIVAKDGTGDFTSLQEVFDMIRGFRPDPTVVILKKGIYKEKLLLHSWLVDVKITGECRDSSIITWDDNARLNNMGTFKTYTLKIDADDITFENLTFENNAQRGGQAVAVHADGDRLIFRNCRFLGNQDTYFGGRRGSRHYFENCYIEGTVDFIFGPSTSWFENCVIHSKRSSFITAASTPESEKYGFIFNNCQITVADGVDSVYLGRPWRDYGMTLFMNSELPKAIRPEGWHNWQLHREKTARYMEYNNRGEGAATANRVNWSRVLTRNEAEEFTLENVMGGCDGWNPKIVK
ncbi:MAG: pectinesterase family protein [Bacteroidales bacterium]|nr:pectinesterase family protein [Bacteroidales bacterium]